MSILSLYRCNKFFFLSWLILIALAIFTLLSYSHASGFVMMNPVHTTALDYFFIIVTLFGDGFFVMGLALVLYFVLRKKLPALQIAASYILSGIIVQVLKYFIEEARPAVFTELIKYPHFIEDVTLHNLHSFPSGHTASAFALAGILAFYCRNKNYGILFLLLATLVGYSRIYLGQHFMDDVLAGSVVGVVSAMVCWIFFDRPFEKFSKGKKNKL